MAGICEEYSFSFLLVVSRKMSLDRLSKNREEEEEEEEEEENEQH